ncbi:MAG TPA: M23 family metallopeptidase [Vicinamibacterales bacterium]|nr:M23 family metallopeptidase [Vicinamibacterales bacterium]
MRSLIRALVFLLLIGGLVYGAAYLYAGTLPGPVVDLRTPEKYVGQNTQLEFAVETPEGAFSRIDAVLTQEGETTTVFSTDPTAQPAGEMKQESANRIFVIRPIGKQALPNLKAGPARVTVTASLPVLYGIRTATTSITRDLEVRLDPPRVGVLSLHHFVNHGGPEFVVFRATPADVTAGVRVGEVEYPAFPGSSVGIPDSAARVAFFVLGYDQDRDAPISVFARDVAGNQATSPVGHRVFPRPFAKSRIEINDPFLQRVVPAIAQNTPGANIDTSDLLKGFLTINRDLRRQNNQTIAELAPRTRPEMMWQEAFSQLSNTSIESRFADYRTYFHNGKEIDQQVHLGFDLASLQRAAVTASNRGEVIFADYLGIYGNCVILDHGFGVQSLYAHLSTIDVTVGETVDKGHTLGRTGATGLAGGDHLHFTLLVGGVATSPIEMWDPHWIEDRVFRKIREAGGQAPTLR